MRGSGVLITPSVGERTSIASGISSDPGLEGRPASHMPSEPLFLQLSSGTCPTLAAHSSFTCALSLQIFAADPSLS